MANFGLLVVNYNYGCTMLYYFYLKMNLGL